MAAFFLCQWNRNGFYKKRSAFPARAALRKKFSMSEILNRFSLEAAKFSGQVVLCLFLIWAAMVYCAVLSINSQSFSERQRRAWLWIVIGLPLLGLLAYLPFSVRREDLPQLFLLKMQKDRQGRKTKPAARPKGGRSA